jgi:hypothetical protein
METFSITVQHQKQGGRKEQKERKKGKKNKK